MGDIRRFNGRRSISAEEHQTILRMAAAGFTPNEIAKRIGRKDSSVRTVIYREKNKNGCVIPDLSGPVLITPDDIRAYFEGRRAAREDINRKIEELTTQRDEIDAELRRFLQDMKNAFGAETPEN